MRWFSLLIFVSFVSCSVDELPPCNGVGVEGNICKEYQYVYGSYNGVNDYEYDLESKLLSSVVTKRKNGSEEGVTYYGYDNEKLVSITLEDSNGKKISEKTIVYNDVGDIEKEKVEGEINTELDFIYINDILIAEVFQEEGITTWVDSLEYYTGTSDLYRKLRYVDGEISQITYFETFTNNIEEEKVTNSNSILQSKKVSRFDSDDNLIEELNYSGSENLLERVHYTYVEGSLESIERFDGSGEEFERLNYQRF